MNHASMLKLRWLRMEAINELRIEDYEMVVDFTTRYQTGESPSFTAGEVAALNRVYTKVRFGENKCLVG